MSESDVAVLVVEDETKLADTYSYWLESEYTVYTAYTGGEALELIEENQDIDIVLLDRRLPRMTGGEVLERIRERGVDCRVAMITAVDPDYDILDMEFEDYVTKPVLKSELQDLVDRLHSLSEYDDHLQATHRLASKLTALEREKSPSELQDHEEYQQAKERYLQLEQNLDSSLTDTEDFLAAYRALGSDGESSERT